MVSAQHDSSELVLFQTEIGCDASSIIPLELAWEPAEYCQIQVDVKPTIRPRNRSSSTCEFTRSRKRAKPAVASRVQRRVRPHGCSEALGRVACPTFMAMKKVDAERISSFASGCDLAGQLSGSYPNSRSSCEQRQALAIFAAHWTAASRDGSSRTQKPPSNSLVCG